MGNNLQKQAEERILGKIQVKCKVCDRNMRRNRQDDKVYYYCDYCRRCVWIQMPDYLDLQ